MDTLKVIGSDKDTLGQRQASIHLNKDLEAFI